MALREVVKMGNPLLRKQSQELSIEEISSPEVQQLIDDMIETMRHYNGAGIAAPQVGELSRIFVMEVRDNPRYPDKPSFPLCVAINPIFEYTTVESIPSWEGCLSIPGIRGRLSRYVTVRLTAIGREGERYTRDLYDFEAVVAQHELDHLDGVLLIDQMSSMETLTFQEEYERYWL